MKRQFFKKTRNKIRDDNEKGAREALLEDLFNDFNRNRWTVYKFNFVRGIFFGFGSVLGGTLLIAGFVWLLNLTGHLVPGIAGFVDHVINLMQHK